jgi:hypothetical protein
MDRETREFYEALSETVKTPGWKLYSDSLNKKIEAIKEELVTGSLDVTQDLLRVAQGRILAYRELISLPYVVEHVFTMEKLEQGITED